MIFCLGCGLPLDSKFNKKWDKKYPDFCNKKCKDRHWRDQKPRNRKKYGLTGSIYDFNRQ